MKGRRWKRKRLERSISFLVWGVKSLGEDANLGQSQSRAQQGEHVGGAEQGRRGSQPMIGPYVCCLTVLASRQGMGKRLTSGPLWFAEDKAQAQAKALVARGLKLELELC
jgi:hypothetical protein